MEIEGEPSKVFHIYRCDIDNEPHERVASYDTAAEVLAHRQRPDWRYKIFANRKFLTFTEFREWAKTRPQ